MCRAERMEIENGRVTRLRAMLQSPRVQEPAPTKLNFDLSQEQLNKACPLINVYSCFTSSNLNRLLWR